MTRTICCSAILVLASVLGSVPGVLLCRATAAEPLSPILLPARDPPEKDRLGFESLSNLRRIGALAFSADGTRLVASNWNLALWNIAKREVLFEAYRGEWIVANEANLLLYQVYRGKPTAVDMLTGKPQKGIYFFPRHDSVEGRDGPSNNSLIAPNARLYAGVNNEAQVIVVDVATGKEKYKLDPQRNTAKAPPKLQPDSDETWGPTFSADSQLLAAATDDGCVTVWEMAKGTEVAVFRFDKQAYTLRGERIAWVNGREALIVPTKKGFYWCDLETKEAVPLSDRAKVEAKKPKPKKGKGKKKPSKPSPQGNPIANRSVGAGPAAFDVYAFSPDGGYLVETSRAFLPPVGEDIKPERIYVYDVDQWGPPIGVIPGLEGDRAWSLKFSPDGEQFAIGTARGNVLHYNTEDFLELAKQGEPLAGAEPDEKDAAGDAAIRKAIGVFKKAGAELTERNVIHANRGSKINDETMQHIQQFPALEILTLPKTAVTDAGLTHLKGLEKLKTIDLSGTGITDAGLKALKDVPNLQDLTIRDTAVTEAGIKQLKAAKPKLRISK